MERISFTIIVVEEGEGAELESLHWDISILSVSVTNACWDKSRTGPMIMMMQGPSSHPFLLSDSLVLLNYMQESISILLPTPYLSPKN